MGCYIRLAHGRLEQSGRKKRHGESAGVLTTMGVVARRWRSFGGGALECERERKRGLGVQCWPGVLGDLLRCRGGGVGAWLVRNGRLQCQLKPLIGRREIKEV
jgi:hypothetical protein